MAFALRRLALSSASKRCFSVAVEAPKTTVGRHLLQLENIGAAKSVEDLQKIAAALPAFNAEKLPESLADMSQYFNSGAAASSEKFVHDKTAWQNMSYGDFIGTEVKRAATWPFIVGLMYVI